MMPAIVVRWPFTRPPAADTKAALMMWLEEGERGEGRKDAIALLRQGDVLFPDRDGANTVLHEGHPNCLKGWAVPLFDEFC